MLGAAVGPITRTGSYYAQILAGLPRRPTALSSRLRGPLSRSPCTPFATKLFFGDCGRAGPAKRATVGEPVLIPCTMGTASYVSVLA